MEVVEGHAAGGIAPPGPVAIVGRLEAVSAGGERFVDVVVLLIVDVRAVRGHASRLTGRTAPAVIVGRRTTLADIYTDT